MISSVPRRVVATLVCATNMVAIYCPLQAQPGPDSGSVLDPSSPLEPVPDFGVDWPDMAAPEPLPPSPSSEPAQATGTPPDQVSAPKPGDAKTPSAMTDGQAEQHYSVTIEGLNVGGAQRMHSRFNELSTLRQGESKAANTAQIDRRARQDEQMLRDVLRAEGYYGAVVTTEVNGSASGVSVVLRVDPGPLYQFSDVAVDGMDTSVEAQASARKAFTIKAGDPVNAEAVLAATTALRRSLWDHGYPFAKVDEPSVRIDHADRSAKLDLKTEPGAFARFGKIEIKGRAPFGARHIGRMARFKPGDVYNIADVDDLRRALIATSLISSVTLTPTPTSDPGVVDLVIDMENAPQRTIAGELGYGTGEGFRAAVSWTHRNLIRPEGSVTFSAVAGTQEQMLGASLRRSNFKKRDRVLTAQVVASHVNRQAYDAKTFTVGGGLERQTNIIWQKKWTWSTNAEILISDERDTIVATGAPRRRTFYIAALPGSLAYDGSDDLLNPTRGFRLSGRVSPEVSFHLKQFVYAKAQFDASAYQPVSKNVVLAGRVRFGTIAGGKRDDIAPSRRFYAGGGGSVRGYGYQDVGPRDVNNDPIGGRSLAEFSLETRVRFGDFGVVPFFDAGNIYTSALPRFTGLQYGAGVGLRYYTSFGPIRLDLGTPINRRKGDPRIAVYVSLGQAF